MFYQNNNDYMRDAFYYSQPQNSTYQYPDMNSYAPYGCNRNYGPVQNPISNMYPQVYRIIDPVASRVVANNNYPYYTEDNLNNMVDTVYNIVQGDISSLTTTTSSTMMSESDDTVTQGPARNSTQTNTTQTNTTSRTSNMEVTRSVDNRDNQLLKDLIKIIIIKHLLSRPNGGGCNCNNQYGYNMNPYMPYMM